MKDLKTDQEHDYEYRMQDDSQEETFMKTSLPEMLDQFLSGYNATFLAYGQTGTGKTHTMFGSRLDKVAEYHEGPFPRAVMTALKKMDEKGCKYVFSANVIEIYFGQIFDLLNQKKPINPYSGGNFDFSGVFETEVKCSADVDR